jgi:hypothetical protein
MEKEFIPYEQALALKELGFDELCPTIYGMSSLRLYDNWKPFKNSEDLYGATGVFCNDVCAAPLYQQAFRWFREKHHIHIEIKYYNDGEEWEDVEYTVIVSDFEDGKTHDTFVKSGFKTYEEAELACLNKLIEIVKQ